MVNGRRRQAAAVLLPVDTAEQQWLLHAINKCCCMAARTRAHPRTLCARRLSRLQG
jgi:hypothetical protein